MRLGLLTFPPSLNRLEAGFRTNVTVALSTMCGSMPAMMANRCAANLIQ
jgi:hypothetical protein